MKDETNKKLKDLEPDLDTKGGGLWSGPLGAKDGGPDGLQTGEATGFHDRDGRLQGEEPIDSF